MTWIARTSSEHGPAADPGAARQGSRGIRMPQERRRSSRVELLGRLHGRVVSLDLPVTVREISLVGLSIQTSVPFPVGALHEFRLTLGDDSTVLLRGRIVYCRELATEEDDAAFVLGVEFVDESPQEGEAVEDLIGKIR